MAEAGYLDDARFARRFAEDRRRLDGWGTRRIEAELARRGVPEDLVEGTVGAWSESGEVEAARAVLRERVGGPLVDDRARRRAFGMLARRGYASEVAYEAIRRHERAPFSP